MTKRISLQSPQLESIFRKLLEKKLEIIKKKFEKVGDKWSKDIINLTPVWRTDETESTTDKQGRIILGDSWERVRSARGSISGNAQRSWKKSINRLRNDIVFRMSNPEAYIRVLEYGGFGAKDSRIWGNYEGLTTKRTRPAFGGIPMKSNVSKQAPFGMVRISNAVAAKSLRQIGFKRSGRR